MSILPLAIAISFCLCPLQAVSQAAPDTAQKHIQAAQHDMQQKHPELAIVEFEAALAIDPQNNDAQANLGVLQYFAGQYDKAVPHLKAAVQQRPSLWKIQALLGLAEDRLKQTADARKDLEAALPNLAGEKVQDEVGNALIGSYSASGELEKAAATVSTLLVSHPTDTRLLLLSYRLHADLANSALLTMAIAAPHSAEMHAVMARELARHGDETAAAANYREALQIDPKLAGVHLEFGNLLFNSSDEKLRSQAEEQFRAALAVNPNDERAQLMLGTIAATRGDTKSAYEATYRAVTMQPNDGEACVDLAKILISMHKLDEARKLLNHAIELDPTDATAHYRLSTLDRQQGKLAEAKAELAEYQKYKDLKEKLRVIFHDMRLPMDGKPEAELGMSR